MNLEELRQLISSFITDSEFSGKAWFAGGCVRDWLLETGKHKANNTLYDIDISVELPQGGILLSEYLLPHMEGTDYSKYPAFGTARFKVGNQSFEFVATRKETYKTGNRYPQVTFGTLSDDVLRRDFTMNGLLMNISSGEVLDLCGKGIADLEAGIIRCIGKPKQKFNEDPLRMLRALRFSLRFGFAIDPETYSAMQSEVALLARLSAKSIQAELTKMLKHNTSEAIQREFGKLGWKLS